MTMAPLSLPKMLLRFAAGRRQEAATAAQPLQSRWETTSSDGVAAAQGAEFANDIDMDDAFDQANFERALLAVSEGPTNWSDDDAIKIATKHYRELRARDANS